MFFRRLVSVRISTSVFYSQIGHLEFACILNIQEGGIISSSSQTADTR